MINLVTTIKTAELTDISLIQEFAETVYRGQFTDDKQRQRFLDRVYSTKSLERSIQNQGTGFVIATDNVRVVGIVHFGSPLIEECTDRKEIHRLFVHPDWVRRGVGKQFLQAMVDYYKSDKRVRQFFAYVSENDAPRQAFYHKYGFVRDARQDKEGEHYFVKTL